MDIDSQQNHSLENALHVYLNRCWPVIERMIQDGEVSDSIWDIVCRFVSYSYNINLEKLLGKVCKCDSEGLNPKASKAIECILKKDPQVCHRQLPGWMVRTFSRLTRRFAEDEILSETTLRSVRDLSMIYSVMTDIQVH